MEVVVKSNVADPKQQQQLLQNQHFHVLAIDDSLLDRKFLQRLFRGSSYEDRLALFRDPETQKKKKIQSRKLSDQICIQSIMATPDVLGDASTRSDDDVEHTERRQADGARSKSRELRFQRQWEGWVSTVKIRVQ